MHTEWPALTEVCVLRMLPFFGCDILKVFVVNVYTSVSAEMGDCLALLPGHSCHLSLAVPSGHA